MIIYMLVLYAYLTQVKVTNQKRPSNGLFSS